MSVTLLSFPVACVFFTLAFIGIYNGAKQGFLRSVILLGADISALFLSFFVTALLSDGIAAYIMKRIAGMALYVDFAEMLPSLAQVLSVSLSMLLSTVLFVFVFFILRAAMRRIALGVYRSRAEQAEACEYAFADGASRARGAVCGFLSAVLLTSALNAPVMGTLVLADRALHIVKQTSTVAYNALGPGNAAMVRSFTGDVSANLFYEVGGGKLIYANAASRYVGGKRVYLLSEVQTVSAMSEDMLNVYKIFLNPSEATEVHVQALRRLSADMQKLTLCEALSADIVSGCSDAWRRGETFLGICRPAVNPVWDTVFDGVLEACSKVTADNVKRNTATMLEAYALILESGASGEDDETILLNLSQSGILKELETLLSENPDTAHIGVSEVAMSAFASFALRSGYREELISETADAIREVNTAGGIASAREIRLAGLLQSVLDEREVFVSQAFMRYAAKQMLRELPGGNVDGNDARRLLEKYAVGAK